MATGTKFSSRTNHIGLEYHHFKSHVKRVLVDIFHTPIDQKLADFITKPLPNDSLFTLRYMLCGCGYNYGQLY